MRTYKKILYLLTSDEKRKAIILLCMILIVALLEMIGVASIMPFMAVLTNPDVIQTNFILKNLFKFSKNIGVENNNQFLFMLGILVFLLLVTSITFKALTSYAQLRFTYMRQYSVGKRMVEGYLHQPFSWFLNRHSADLGKNILSEVGQVVNKGLNPCLNLIQQILVTVALLSILIIVNLKLALIVGITLGLAYSLIYLFTHGLIGRIGKERLKASELLFVTLSEAFSAIKEIKVGGVEKNFVNRFSDPANNLAKSQALLGLISSLPRFALEVIAFGGIMLVILYLIAQSGNFNDVIPIIALYVFAGYRLMPALQGIYNSVAQIRYIEPALDALYKDLINLKSATLVQDKSRLIFKKGITLKNIFYQYPKSQKMVLKNINFSISVSTKIGIVGTTGSGKTTIVDIILGLLEVQKGDLKVDGKLIDKNNLRSWQNSIGYVPQNIFLADDTVSANIAFGVEDKKINQESVENAAKIASLHKFVINDLPQKYQTTIGEKGIRLSGGQRQRIGIARALYHNPKLLILDEATSSLDNLTEQAVMEAVNNMSKDTTIIMIAHRLSTVKECDNIIVLENGELKQQGTFEELIRDNDNFRAASEL
jgi:ABC-type multidrug transport system fused ATPase/permease subunit